MEATEIINDGQQKERLLTKKTKLAKSIFIIAAAIVLVVAAITVLSALKANKIKAQLENKIFVTGEMNGWIRVYAFSGGKLAKEMWYLNTHKISGDITKFNYSYRVVPSIFSDEIKIMSRGVKMLTVYLDENGKVQYYGYTERMPGWQEVTQENVKNMRTEKMCEHNFGKDVIIKTATCTMVGETSRTCMKCGYLETRNIGALAHNYENKICTECGAKKQSQKANDIEANTWYTYQDVIRFQNIKLHRAFSVSQGKGMSVSYYFVCQHCHVVDESLRTNVPEFNYAINKMFTCEECGGLTTVKIELG